MTFDELVDHLNDQAISFEQDEDDDIRINGGEWITVQRNGHVCIDGSDFSENDWKAIDLIRQYALAQVRKSA